MKSCRLQSEVTNYFHFSCLQNHAVCSIKSNHGCSQNNGKDQLLPDFFFKRAMVCFAFPNLLGLLY